MKKIIAAAMMLAATPALADPIAPQDVASHMGGTVTVEGQITVRTEASGITYLDMGGVYPKNAFMAVIMGSTSGLFPHVAGFNGRTADITGTVQDFNGKPEIILTSPSQVIFK